MFLFFSNLFYNEIKIIENIPKIIPIIFRVFNFSSKIKTPKRTTKIIERILR